MKTPVAYFSEHVPRFESGSAYDWPIPKEGLKAVERFAKSATRWPDAIPVAYPRFHDVYRKAGVSGGFETIADEGGHTLRTTLEAAMKLRSRFIQIATWNDWGEGTQIEPSVEHGFRDLKIISEHVGDSGSPVGDSILDLPRRLLKLRRVEGSKSTADEIAEQIVGGKLANAATLLDIAEAAAKN